MWESHELGSKDALGSLKNLWVNDLKNCTDPEYRREVRADGVITKDESEKLASKDYCQSEWVEEYKGVTVSGWVVKGKAGSAYENNEVFFPADGYGYSSSLSQAGSLGRYWSSTPNLGESELAWNLSFDSGIFNASFNGRYFGSSVRAVRDTPPEPPSPEGSEGNPWKVGGTDGTGDLVEAWTNGTGVLTVQGAGSVTNLADVIADWADIKGGITAINVASNGVTGAMAQAFAGLGDPTPVALTLPDGWQGELPDGGNWYGAKVELRDGYPLTVRNVRARQRWPWNGKVDVLCDMTGPAGAKEAIVTVKDGETALTNFTAEVTIPEGGVLATNFVWDAMTAGLAANFKSDDVTVEVAIAEPTEVRLWKGGPYFATCNVGAKTPQEYGYYFWWGDTVGYTNSGSAWVSVADGTTPIRFTSTDATATNTYKKVIDVLKSEGWIDNCTNLVAAHDAATAHLGAPWRMMTKDELDKLRDATVCQRVWTNEYKGVTVYGWVVKGKEGTEYANNEVFFPLVGQGSGSSLSNAGTSGCYWSSTPDSDDRPDRAWYLQFSSSEVKLLRNTRYLGMPVRAVRDTK